MVGSFIMYVGVLLNEFIFPNLPLITLLFVVLAIIVANKIGKSLWNGLATVILFFIFSFYITKNIGEPEEFGMMSDLLIYQGIIAILTTVTLEQLSKKQRKSQDIN
ncbi:hypothetical protein [Halalkalibacter alkalisediminis]|uniref:Uncharacterized protein n=1 Tax=Halalkalibacter alkalisediminis TaxID=935616 RepID=A0ABV6NL69_9BACI|nr:hypothetical protein [Halalkalibacter alkalisediminis]